MPSNQHAVPFRVHVAIALLSAALLAFQLAQMQLFALVQWHHYAFLVISIALTGFGASGTLFSILRTRMLAERRTLFPALASLSAILMIVCTAATLLTSAAFDPFLLFTDVSHVWRLLLTCLLLFLPFLPGALVLVLSFATWPDRIGGLYLSNLGGSAAGGLLAVLLPWMLPPEQIPAAVALLAAGASFLLIPGRRAVRPMPRTMLLIPSAAMLLCLAAFPLLPAPEISEYKNLSRTLDLPDAEITAEANSPYGMLHVVHAPALRHAPGLSLTYTGPIPVREAVFRDGGMLGVLVAPTEDQTPPLLDYSTRALPYALGSVSRVLLLDAGTGEEVAQALHHGADHVTAVLPDGRLRSMLTGRLAAQTDSLFHDRRVQLEPRDARSVLARGESYDLIIHPVVESMGGSAGLRALQEEYTLTVEAFTAMWRRLGPGGRIEVTVWMDYPWRSTMRLPATLAAMLQGVGREPRRHIAAVRGWGTMTFVVTRSPLSDADARRVRGFCQRLQFDPALLPRINDDERQRYHAIGQEGFFRALDTLLGPSRDTFVAEYPFRISPATDDRPFFSQFLTPASLEVISDEAGRAAVPTMELGSVTVLAAVAAVTVLALLFIVLPLLPRGMRGGGGGWTFLHFAAIGMGFMFVEILLLHHFVLYFGNPVYAAAAVITVLLLCAGIGSRVSERLHATGGTLVRVCGAIAVLLLVGALVLQPLLTETMHAVLPIKVLIAVVVMLPPGMLMGMPFPTGIRILGVAHPSHIPWAWAINGSLSVVATGAATVLALQFGFSFVFIAAAAMYAVAAAAGFLR